MWTSKERAALYEFCDQFTNADPRHFNFYYVDEYLGGEHIIFLRQKMVEEAKQHTSKDQTDSC